jgi:hypothetical protein
LKGLGFKGLKGFKTVMNSVIDLSPVKVGVPQSWGEAASFLGASHTTVSKCRKALDRFEEPISLDLVEEIRRMVRFCEMRNAGGGSTCTRQEYLRIQSEEGQAVLEVRLRQFGII